MNYTPQTLAAEIARRRKELAEDSAENVEQLILGMLQQTNPVDSIGQQLTALSEILKTISNDTLQPTGFDDLIQKDVLSAIRRLAQKIHQPQP